MVDTIYSSVPNYSSITSGDSWELWDQLLSLQREKQCFTNPIVRKNLIFTGSAKSGKTSLLDHFLQQKSKDGSAGGAAPPSTMLVNTRYARYQQHSLEGSVKTVVNVIDTSGSEAVTRCYLRSLLNRRTSSVVDNIFVICIDMSDPMNCIKEMERCQREIIQVGEKEDRLVHKYVVAATKWDLVENILNTANLESLFRVLCYFCVELPASLVCTSIYQKASTSAFRNLLKELLFTNRKGCPTNLRDPTRCGGEARVPTDDVPCSDTKQVEDHTGSTRLLYQVKPCGLAKSCAHVFVMEEGKDSSLLPAIGLPKHSTTQHDVRL